MDGRRLTPDLIGLILPVEFNCKRDFRIRRDGWKLVMKTYINSLLQRMYRAIIVQESGKWTVIMRIPLTCFWWSEEAVHPIRVDLQVQREDGSINSWYPDNPITERLMFGTDNPADLSWLVFGNPVAKH
jgi:hypothetical protein